MQKKRWLVLAGVIAGLLSLAVLVAACGDNGDGDGDGDGVVPTATEPAEPEPTATEAAEPEPTATEPAEPEPTATEAAEPEPTATEPADGEETGLRIVGENILFDKDTLEAPAGEGFTVVFDNQDSGVPHNFAIYTDETASDQIAGTPIETGLVVQVLEVEGLEAGEYFYRCDVHPTQMTGTLVVQ